MEIALFIIGVTVVFVTLYDITTTILAPRGVGLIADRVSRGIWRFSLVLSGKNGRNRPLRSVGPFLLLIIIFIWVILMWLGNTLIVYSDSQSLWSPDKSAYVNDFAENMYFVAYVLSSMGSGNYTPVSDWWLFYTGLISYTGVIFISLSISFLIPVVEAITLKREVSLRIHALGKNPQEILTRYKDDNYRELLEVLADLEPSILKLAQYHLAYPVIHYFHAVNLFESLPVKLVSLDEAMSILMYKIPEENIANRVILERTYESMTYYLSTLASAFIKPGDDEPEYPDISYLEHISEESSIKGTEWNDNLKGRRLLLLAYLQNDGWGWDDMVQSTDRVQINI
ncbi:hypothetical protein [Flavimarina sp. Hel_I_48]|uniref:hypothetical protein n=1 Tax=Flavimarina sp. Hel_I_48 TaxID=1392488 RepID=UPI0004DF2EDA|nr:hypothetical protein [Flavimarina sp. Hel_I_48]